MKLHEVMGIEANRRWGVCSLNEFRKVPSFILLRIVDCNSHICCSSLALNVSIRFSYQTQQADPIFFQLIPVSWNGTPTRRLRKRQNAFIPILRISNCMLGCKPKKPNLSLTVQACALVCLVLLSRGAGRAQHHLRRIHCDPCYPQRCHCLDAW